MDSIENAQTMGYKRKPQNNDNNKWSIEYVCNMEGTNEIDMDWKKTEIVEKDAAIERLFYFKQKITHTHRETYTHAHGKTSILCVILHWMCSFSFTISLIQRNAHT